MQIADKAHCLHHLCCELLIVADQGCISLDYLLHQIMLHLFRVVKIIHHIFNLRQRPCAGPLTTHRGEGGPALWLPPQPLCWPALLPCQGLLRG